MLDTHKLIYILPEVAYVTEMLPGKKQHTFTVHNFRQINGEFIKDDSLVVSSIIKLFSKLDPDTYQVILPDSLFTNTIISTTETGESKVKAYVTQELLPSLSITSDTHYVDYFVLTEFKGVAKVQLTALEKEIVAPLKACATQYDLKLNGVSPLSWTIKSVVSLEPSITVLQLGSQVYTALQYIGVDQATIAPVSDLDLVSETIKTLKGSESSIQTVYVISNELVEKGLKDRLSTLLPLQQLADFSEDDTKLPSYVRCIIESGMRTLAIADYPVPNFHLGKATEEELSLYVAGNLAAAENDTDDDTEEVSAALPAPTPVASIAAPVVPLALEPDTDLALEAGDETESRTDDSEEETHPVEAEDSDTDQEDNDFDSTSDDDDDEKDDKDDNDDEDDKDELEHTSEDSDDEHDDDNDDDETDSSLTVEDASPIAATIEPVITKPSVTFAGDSNPPVKQFTPPEEVTKPSSDIDISQFTQAPTMQKTTADTPVTTSQPVIKNKSGVGGMIKMLLITLLVFCITVAVGVGVGLGILSLTNKQTASNTEVDPAPVASVTPQPEATPTPTPVAEVDSSTISVLVVNATSKAGYASTIKTKIEAGKYEKVATGNAKGDYETGNYVLMKTANEALVTKLAKDSGLELKFQETGYETEDATGAYDVVVVLAE